MNEDKNVIDLEARAAQQRAHRQGFLLTELDGSTIKSILESGYIDCELDVHGESIACDELRMVVSADPPREVFKLYAFFWAKGRRQQVLEFCERFNANLVVVKAQMRDAPDKDGDWPVIIDHDRLMFEQDRLAPRTLVTLVRRFQFIARNGMTRYDTEHLL